MKNENLSLNQKSELNTHIERILGERIMNGPTAAMRNEMALGLVVDAMRKQGPSQAFSLAKNLIQLHPNSLEILIPFYQTVRNQIGSSELGTDIANEYTKIASSHMDQLCNFFRTPPLHISGWMLNRIGEAVDQTAGVIKAQRLGVLKYRPVICLEDGQRTANDAFLPYISDAFDILTDPKKISSFKSQRVLPRFDSYLMRFSDEVYGHASEYESNLNSLLIRNGLETTAFALKESTMNVAKDFLKHYDLSDGDSFVTFHNREEGYADAAFHEERNCDPQVYQKAINLLINNGIKVVRIGHKRMTELKPQNGFIDLTKIDRPGEVDIYLCAQSLFYFGSSSGPYSLSYQFGRPSLLIELFPFSQARPNGLNHMKRFYDERTDEVINFEKLKNMDLNNVFSADAYKLKGLKSHSVTACEILASTKEMLDWKPGCLLFKENEKLNPRKNSVGVSHNVMFSSRSLELLI